MYHPTTAPCQWKLWEMEMRMVPPEYLQVDIRLKTLQKGKGRAASVDNTSRSLSRPVELTGYSPGPRE